MDISGVKMLTLMTTDGGNGIGSDHSIFADNYLIDRAGHKTKLELSRAKEWGESLVNGVIKKA